MADTRFGRLLHRLPLGSKFILMLALPLMGLGYFNLAMLVEKWQLAQEMDRVGRMVELSGALSDFVHAIQLEREALVRAEGRERLAAARKESDSALDELNLRFAVTDLDLGSREGVAEARAQTTRLKQMRAELEAGQITPAALAAWQTEVNLKLLGISRQLLHATSQVSIASQLFAYYSLLFAKEHTGQERVLLIGAVRSRQLAAAERGRLLGVMAARELYLQLFAAYADGEFRDLYREADQQPCAAEAARLREALLGGANIPAGLDLQGECAIKLMHSVEEQMLAGLARTAYRLQGAAWRSLVLAGGISLLLALVSLWLIFAVARRVGEQTHEVTGTLEGLSRGDLERRARVLTGDELGQIAMGANEMAARLAATAQAELLQRRREQEGAERIRQQVEEIRAFVAAVAAGDLTRRIDLTGDDALAGLAVHLNAMTESLAAAAGDIRTTGTAILAEVRELQSAVSAQSSGASEQAASVTETSTTLEEIRVTALQTREKAASLGQSAEHMREEGARGLAAVEENGAAIREIGIKVEAISDTILALSRQTQQIGDIVGVVNSLARQSRMLALNAAIEAAKAGEAGKGFAVVAGEVKALAEQSQQSTAQVQRILLEIRGAADRAVMVMEEGLKGVEAGLRGSERTGEVVQALGELINETALFSQQIVAAVRQESIGIDQIAAAMNDINGVTRHFVTTTRQTSEAVARLGAIAEQLEERVRVYRL